MPQLKNGNEHCDKCHKRYIALLAKDSCMCEVVVQHTDPDEKETALALANKKLKRTEAKVAELEAKLKIATDSAWESKK